MFGDNENIFIWIYMNVINAFETRICNQMLIQNGKLHTSAILYLNDIMIFIVVVSFGWL